MYGYTGTILRVNLKKGTIVKEPLNQKNAKEYVGARGLGTKYFCDECDPKCDPLGPGQQADHDDRPAHRHLRHLLRAVQRDLQVSADGHYRGVQLRAATSDRS